MSPDPDGGGGDIKTVCHLTLMGGRHKTVCLPFSTWGDIITRTNDMSTNLTQKIPSTVGFFLFMKNQNFMLK